jgi:hypothetical protein
MSVLYSATDTEGDQHQRQQTMRANHAVFDPIFIQYIIIMSAKRQVQGAELTISYLGDNNAPTAVRKVGFSVRFGDLAIWRFGDLAIW